MSRAKKAEAVNAPAARFERKTPNITPEFVGRLTAAALLDVSPQTIDKAIREARLRVYRLGRKVLVRRADLFRLVEEGEV